MYFEMIQQFTKTLRNLDKILGRACTYAETRKFDANNFVSMRLHPDMFPLNKQIQIACDVAKAAGAYLTAKEAPKFDDVETTMNDLRERIAKTLNYLETCTEAETKKVSAKTVVKIPYPAGKSMYLNDSLISRSIPNFFFHVSMTYALLRMGGVEIGKMDYLGDLKIFDAQT